VQINFQHAQGDLDLALYNSAGTLLGRSQGTTDSERVSLNGLAAGTYYIQVYGYRGASNPSYTLDINPALQPPPPPPPSGGFGITLTFSGLTPSQVNVFNQAAARWAQVITGDLPDVVFQGRVIDDLAIDARAVPIDGVNNILGQAAPDQFRSGSLLPYHGFMEFDTADLSALEANGQLFSVIVHEMGHVLGIGTLWQAKGLLAGAGTSNPVYVGGNGVAAYNAIFGATGNSVPVENTGGDGTRDSHWRESVFGAELMTGFINPGANPLSRVTAASLIDLGYSVNLAAADGYTPPRSVRAVTAPAGLGSAPAYRLITFREETGFLEDQGGRGDGVGESNPERRALEQAFQQYPAGRFEALLSGLPRPGSTPDSQAGGGNGRSGALGADSASAHHSSDVSDRAARAGLFGDSVGNVL
jgi:hypothetical protein